MTKNKRSMIQAVLKNMIVMQCPTIDQKTLDLKLSLKTDQELFEAYKKHLGM